MLNGNGTMKVLELASVVDAKLATVVCGSDSGTSPGPILNPSGLVLSNTDDSCHVP